MSGILNSFSCCTRTCDVNKDGVVNTKDFEDAIYVVSKDFKVYLAKAVELSKNLDVAVQNAIKYLTLAKVVFALEKDTIAKIDEGIKVLNLMLATDKMAQGVAREVLEASAVTDAATASAIIQNGIAANAHIKAYLQALQAAGVDVGNAEEQMKTIDAAFQKTNALVTLYTVVTASTPTAANTATSNVTADVIAANTATSNVTADDIAANTATSNVTAATVNTLTQG